jgi:hypothetical protein
VKERIGMDVDGCDVDPSPLIGHQCLAIPTPENPTDASVFTDEGVVNVVGA